MTGPLKSGDYIDLQIDNVLIQTGVLKDIGKMASRRTVYQVLLVKNTFQRDQPEIHFSDTASIVPFNFSCLMFYLPIADALWGDKAKKSNTVIPGIVLIIRNSNIGKLGKIEMLPEGETYGNS